MVLIFPKPQSFYVVIKIAYSEVVIQQGMV